MSSEKILLIKLFQPFAQYRNPLTFYYAQTYPLPPKSTIIGMLQNAVGDWYGHELGPENWYNLKVSVHGGAESVFWNYQSLIKGIPTMGDYGLKIEQKTKGKSGKGKSLQNEGEYKSRLYGEGITAQRSPVYQQELYNLRLYIFIKGDDDTLLAKIKENLEKPKKVLSLGRSEDIIFLHYIKEIEGADSDANTKEIKKTEGSANENIKLTLPTYIKQSDFPIATKKYPIYSIPTKILFKNGKHDYIEHKNEISRQEVLLENVLYTGYDYLLRINKQIRVEIFWLNEGHGKEKEIRIVENYGWL